MTSKEVEQAIRALGLAVTRVDGKWRINYRDPPGSHPAGRVGIPPGRICASPHARANEPTVTARSPGAEAVGCRPGVSFHHVRT
jgi:hypothetical protein